MVRNTSNRCTPTIQQVNMIPQESDNSANENSQMPPEAMSALSDASP